MIKNINFGYAFFSDFLLHRVSQDRLEEHAAHKCSQDISDQKPNSIALNWMPEKFLIGLYAFLVKMNCVELTEVKLKNPKTKTINNDKNFKCICFNKILNDLCVCCFMGLNLPILYLDKNSFADNSGNYWLVTVDRYRHP